MEPSDWLSLIAILISFYALYRTERTAKDQLCSEVFIAANALVSVITEVFYVMGNHIDSTSTLPDCYDKDEIDSIKDMCEDAAKITQEDLSAHSREYLRRNTGFTKIK